MLHFVSDNLLLAFLMCCVLQENQQGEEFHAIPAYHIAPKGIMVVKGCNAVYVVLCTMA